MTTRLHWEDFTPGDIRTTATNQNNELAISSVSTSFVERRVAE